jgi:SurA N-terminal domain
MKALTALAVLALAVLTLAAAPAPKPAPAPKTPPKPAAAPAPSPKADLKDRILAVVDEDPILQSDLDRTIALGLKQRNPNEEETAFRRRVLNELIEERLRFHEIDRFGFGQVPVSEIDSHVAEIRNRFKDEATFEKTLKEHGMTVKSLRQLVARQLLTLSYVGEQLGPRVFVSLDDITKYYKEVLTPEMQKRGQPVPPLDDVRDQIRTVLREQRLNEVIGKWTEELRRKANVQVYFDQPSGPLPPLVKKIEKPAKPAKKKP